MLPPKIVPQVANVVLPPRILPVSWSSGKSLSLEMLKAGWAITYEQVSNALLFFIPSLPDTILQAGAEYGKWGKDEFLKVEAEAKCATFLSCRDPR